jgi:hypothetical protein
MGGRVKAFRVSIQFGYFVQHSCNVHPFDMIGIVGWKSSLHKQDEEVVVIVM